VRPGKNIITKRTGARIIYGSDPSILVKKLLDYYATDIANKPII